MVWAGGVQTVRVIRRRVGVKLGMGCPSRQLFSNGLPARGMLWRGKACLMSAFQRVGSLFCASRKKSKW